MIKKTTQLQDYLVFIWKEYCPPFLENIIESKINVGQCFDCVFRYRLGKLNLK